MDWSALKNNRLGKWIINEKGYPKPLTVCLSVLIVLLFICQIPMAINSFQNLFPIKASNPIIVKYNGDPYACITIHNTSIRGAIVKLDLYDNQCVSDMSTIITWPVNCNINRGDSCVVKFKIQGQPSDMEIVSGFKNKYIVAKFANGDKRYYQFTEDTHLFRCKNISLPKPDNSFRFLGKGVNREENFDQAPEDVTTKNIRHLYREYNVEAVSGTDLYVIYPKNIYTDSFYFTRLIKFVDGKQVAAQTFYGWNIPFVFAQGESYMIGMNSLATTAGCNKSTFTCKTVLLDSKLQILKQREFKYKEQSDAYYAYAYIKELHPTNNGYEFTIINTGFDADDYYEYKGFLSFDDIVVRSVKRNIKVDDSNM